MTTLVGYATVLAVAVVCLLIVSDAFDSGEPSTTPDAVAREPHPGDPALPAAGNIPKTRQ